MPMPLIGTSDENLQNTGDANRNWVYPQAPAFPAATVANQAPTRVEGKRELAAPLLHQPPRVAASGRSGGIVEVDSLNFDLVFGDIADHLGASRAAVFPRHKAEGVRPDDGNIPIGNRPPTVAITLIQVQPIAGLKSRGPCRPG